MKDYSGSEYDNIKHWIAEKIENGFSWDDVDHFCVDKEQEKEEFIKLKNEELIIPNVMKFDEWKPFVSYLKSKYSQIIDMFGFADEKSNNLPVPSYQGSPWPNYKDYLLGKKTGEPKMSDEAVTMIENNCHWIVNHLERDTRQAGPTKGLVMGSVQSGKTANMIGLVSMAAAYDWNVFIVLSGTIDNLRKQTRDRFLKDLKEIGALSWRILDYTNNPDYMIELESKKKITPDDLNLNIYQNGVVKNNWLNRYVLVCLKNSRRLQNLITWLHANQSRSAKMRIIVIDDEADQASVNTVKMGEPQSEEEIERTAVNKLIINLVKGNDKDGNPSPVQFQAMNYISFTATPYANVLNEAYRDSLYPSNFICSLPESKEYFGPKVIWGSKTDEKYNGLNIIRTIPDEEIKEIKQLNKGQSYTLPEVFKKSIAWFLCTASVLRKRNHKSPVSMLIHTTSIQNGHFEEYSALQRWLNEGKHNGEVLEMCEKVYEEEKDKFRLDDLREGYPDYALLESVNDYYLPFCEIKDEIETLISDVVNIKMDENKKPHYHENGIHLCVDNCKANKIAEEGTFLRIVYPDKKMEKAPVFIIMGGNTLSRGLTLEGLVCTYFARNVNQADTLMQMARWFGYRRGYELLQRIWMSELVQEKFELIEEIDEKLKFEFEDFMKKGKSPSMFGPRVMSSSKIARFLITSKSKSQNMIACDVDFSGDSYEVTKFENNGDDLKKNIDITDEFIKTLGIAKKSEAIDSAYYWDDIDSESIITNFIEKYKIFNCSPLHIDIPIFVNWIRQMNKEKKYLKWNVAVAGDKGSSERWIISGANVGKIERSKKIKTNEKIIDIGSLRSGRDILSDIALKNLSLEKKVLFDDRKKRGVNLISLRFELGYSDIPLLLLYKIDKNKGKQLKTRKPIGSDEDIIGFSIIVSGEEISADYIRTVQVKKPEI